MSLPLPLCYLNGAYLPLTEARVSPLDRAFQDGDRNSGSAEPSG